MSAEVTADNENPEATSLPITYFAGVGENPALSRVPVFNTNTELAAAIQFLPDFSPGSDISVDDRLLIPTIAHRKLFRAIATSVAGSANERDLSTPEYRARVINAFRLINYRRDSHGHNVLSTEVCLPNVSTKVHFAVVPNGVGQRAFINACQRVFRTEAMLFEVPIEGYARGARFARMDTIVVPFPPNGNAETFGRELVRHVSHIFDLRHVLPVMRDGGVATAMQSVLLALNVGLVVVGPVSHRMSNATKAAELWSTLGQVARATGIPFVIVGTPGAAVSLLGVGDAEAALTSQGSASIELFSLDSRGWDNAAQLVWLKYFWRFGKIPPTWFSAALHAVTLGRIELTMKVGAYVASLWTVGATPQLSRDIFIAHAHEALRLQKPMLDAVRSARAGGTFSLGRLRSYSDWLPLSVVVDSVLRLDDGSDVSQKRFVKDTHSVVRGPKVDQTSKTQPASEHADEAVEEAKA
ncbi:hypothetical protein ACPWR0_14450 [Pandoraea pneumonica]|uniref:hypothetical protein n=1 Tax=Pandoraea pneumonica TaxID=2508299 RepID=UPI003CEEFC4B